MTESGGGGCDYGETTLSPMHSDSGIAPANVASFILDRLTSHATDESHVVTTMTWFYVVVLLQSSRLTSALTLPSPITAGLTVSLLYIHLSDASFIYGYVSKTGP